MKRNSKSEIRNPKQIQRTQIQMTETLSLAGISVWGIVISIIRACFEFRISAPRGFGFRYSCFLSGSMT